MGPIEGYQYNLDELAQMRDFNIHFEAEFRGDTVAVQLGHHGIQAMMKKDQLCSMLWTCTRRRGDEVTFMPSKLYESMAAVEVYKSKDPSKKYWAHFRGLEVNQPTR